MTSTNIFDINPTDHALQPIIDKLSAGERLSFDDGIALEKSCDFHTICQLADRKRELVNGSSVGYIVNTHLDYTNICSSMCKFCGFAKSNDAQNAYCIEPSDAPALISDDVDEIHIVGGINPALPLKYFIDLVTTLHTTHAHATIKAFSAVELFALADREQIGIADILKELKDAGLRMIPGGGAEIFSDRVRKKICPNKATAEQWLEVHRVAHQLGIPSNSTMLYGHIESAEDRIDHLLRLRALQDDTEGFVAHIPLPYLPSDSTIVPVMVLTGLMDLRQIAIARLMLENIPHIKAYWRALGLKTAQVALRAGADDLDGTITHEKVMESAGSEAPSSLTPEQMETLIKQSRLKPYRRNSFHESMEVCN
jgi:aminodeoxyfutalosine synthase